MKYFVYILLVIFFSCQSKQENIKEKPVLHEDLIYTNLRFMADLGDENWEKLQPQTNNKIEPKYLDDIIYISQLVDANACGNYVGDIEIKKDSIYLICKMTSKEICTSMAIYKATYIIKNPEIKKYKMAIKYE
ncbi:hypothetical protein [Flavobacterium reichenbachii]|uniref:Lipoprotein n=1 Tax=Flavobacterium reichenbachii TaxID=362418 RepID=A0A085ZM07_9FLAO|nr:hypothetical protein [Flavobacterium reichenbachii]KFF05471.1 hypothetical protein IW19_08045 [Flavobacterium reichenbachii]OXB17811.1 hypothetical protein B0A68_02385 [Flavobacterium reichenbachii]